MSPIPTGNRPGSEWAGKWGGEGLHGAPGGRQECLLRFCYGDSQSQTFFGSRVSRVQKLIRVDSKSWTGKDPERPSQERWEISRRKGGLSLGCVVALAGSFAVLKAPSSVSEVELRDSQKGFVRVLMWRGGGGGGGQTFSCG